MERRQVEKELLARGIALPLQHREAWLRLPESPESWFLAVLDESGQSCGGFAIEVSRSRALPFHKLLRAQRCGSTNSAISSAAFQALKQLAMSDWRVLRLNVELFSFDAAARKDAADVLEALGFHSVIDPRSYSQTLSIDLSPAEDIIFSRFSASARSNIRAVGKRAFEIRQIVDPVFGLRMNELNRATRERTGGKFVSRDWSGIMEFCTNHPELARLVGIFRSDSGGPGSLLAFACALHHTDHVQYYTAASTRDEGVKFPLTHGLIWDLVRWAKAHGAKSFDMGGVTAGNVASGDPLGGISDFKRFFSKTPVDAGEEWELEPRAASAKFAQFISTAAYRFSTRKRS